MRGKGCQTVSGTLAGHDLAEIGPFFYESSTPYILRWSWVIAIQLTLISSFVGHVVFLSWS